MIGPPKERNAQHVTVNSFFFLVEEATATKWIIWTKVMIFDDQFAKNKRFGQVSGI